MIAFLKGVLAGKTLTAAYIDVNGVGYEVGMSSASLSKLPAAGQPVQVFTHLQVREDDMSLFGFVTADEKRFFEKLITVSGVGAKVALAALSTYAPHELGAHIANQDIAAIQRIPGVGKKGASRIVLELKGSLDDFGGTAGADQAVPAGSASLPAATEALLSMGFTSAEAEVALKGAPEAASETALIQYALKRLGG